RDASAPQAFQCRSRGALSDALQRLSFRTLFRHAYVADVFATVPRRRALWRRRPLSDARHGVPQRGRRRDVVMPEFDVTSIQDAIVTTTLPVASRVSRTLSASPIWSKGYVLWMRGLRRPAATQSRTCSMLARCCSGARRTASPQKTPAISAPLSNRRLRGIFGISPAANTS